jgi:ABC-type antimicrobial peptide transport system permease subunit
MIDPAQPPHGLRMLSEGLDEHLAPRRVKMALTVTFALLALGLGVVGIYAVLAYAVKGRTHEMGIRLALGAGQSRIVGMVLKNGLVLVGSGVAIGGLLSVSLFRFMASELWGVTKLEPGVMVVVVAVLLASGVAASLVPAMRAARVDPIRSLRSE